MRFGVITEVSAPEDGGNMACDLDIFRVVEERSAANGFTERLEQVPPQTLLGLRTPVFSVGEVLILDDGGREIPYPGRKPSKWSVGCEEFDDLEAALARAKEVLDGE